MRWLLDRLIYGLVRLLHATYRYRHVGIENLEAAHRMGAGGSYLLGIWHQNVLAGILAQTGGEYVVIVSRSQDANPVALTCESLGHHVCRGSSRKDGIDKGGREAKQEMVALLLKGLPGAVTVDGPKGPAKEVKPGIVDMAREAKVPLVPYVPIPDSHWTLGTWDRFRLPKPFCRIVVYYGEPFEVPADATGDTFAELQAALAERLEEGEKTARSHLQGWSRLDTAVTPAARWVG